MKETNKTISKPSELSLLKPSDLFDPTFRPDLRAVKKSNFQITFCFVRDKNRRKALDDLYAFCRLIDDIADEEGLSTENRQNMLNSIKEWLNRLPETRHLFWDRWKQSILSLQINKSILFGIIEGVETDLRIKEFASEKDLDLYIYGVASCVGEAVLEVIGAKSIHSKLYSHHMGRAAQLWNIMRDLEIDLAQGRIYVPSAWRSTFSFKDEIPKLRSDIYERAQGEWAKAKPYSWKCLPAELMVAFYAFAAKKFWRLGNQRSISTGAKISLLIQALTMSIYRIFRRQLVG